MPKPLIKPQAEIYRGVQIHYNADDNLHYFTDSTGYEHVSDIEYCRAAIDLMHLVIENVRKPSRSHNGRKRRNKKRPQ